MCCRTCGNTTVLGGVDQAAFSELANAVQSAVLASEELQAKTRPENISDIRSLQAALRRVTLALRRLRR
jgi:hypothetical protein